MESTDRTPTFDDTLPLAQVAADWLHRLEYPSTNERIEFAQWIGRSPRNARELLLAAVWDLMLLSLDGVSSDE